MESTNEKEAMKLTVLVERSDGPDSVVAKRAEDLDDGFFVGSHSGDGFVQLLGVVVRQRRHQRDNDVLELSGQFVLQVVNEILAVEGFVGLGDLESLHDTAPSQDFDDCLLVGAETLHRLAEDRCVGVGIEGLRRVDRRGALECNSRLECLHLSEMSWVEFNRSLLMDGTKLSLKIRFWIRET